MLTHGGGPRAPRRSRARISQRSPPRKSLHQPRSGGSGSNGGGGSAAVEANLPEQRHDGATVLKLRLLRSFGHLVVPITWWEWEVHRTADADLMPWLRKLMRAEKARKAHAEQALAQAAYTARAHAIYEQASQASPGMASGEHIAATAGGASRTTIHRCSAAPPLLDTKQLSCESIG